MKKKRMKIFLSIFIPLACVVVIGCGVIFFYIGALIQAEHMAFSTNVNPRKGFEGSYLISQEDYELLAVTDRETVSLENVSVLGGTLCTVEAVDFFTVTVHCNSNYRVVESKTNRVLQFAKRERHMTLTFEDGSWIVKEVTL